MTIRSQRWAPDTHPGTIIDEEWDDEVPPEDRVHTPVRAWVDGVPQNAVEVATRVRRENKRKNEGLGHLIDNLPAAALMDEVDDLGQPTGRKVPKPQFLPTWSKETDGEGDMVIVLRLPAALTNGQKVAARARLAERFGTKVRLDD